MSQAADKYPIPSTYARIIARVLQLQEHELPRLLAGTGLPIDILMPGDETHISGEQLLQILSHGQRISGAPEFGLMLGRQLQPSAHGPLGYLALSSPDLMSSLEALRDYMPVRFPWVTLSLQFSGNWLRCELRLRIDADSGEKRIMAECFSLVIQSQLEEVLGRRLSEGEIHFAHPPPAYRAKYGEYLHSPFKFEAPSNCFLIPDHMARAPNVVGDTSSYAVARQTCNALLEQRPRSSGSMADRVRTLLLVNPVQSISEADVARALYVSRRTLVRRLDGEKTSYREVRQTLLKDLAQRYLLESNQTVDSVAAMLGYYDGAAFRKAFRRWTGMSPADYRARSASGDVSQSGNGRTR